MQAKGALHDQAEDAGDLFQVEEDQRYGYQQVSHRHERYGQLGKTRDSAQAAKDDQRGNQYQHYAGQPLRHAEATL